MHESRLAKRALDWNKRTNEHSDNCFGIRNGLVFRRKHTKKKIVQNLNRSRFVSFIVMEIERTQSGMSYGWLFSFFCSVSMYSFTLRYALESLPWNYSRIYSFFSSLSVFIFLSLNSQFTLKQLKFTSNVALLNESW